MQCNSNGEWCGNKLPTWKKAGLPLHPVDFILADNTLPPKKSIKIPSQPSFSGQVSEDSGAPQLQMG